MINAAMASGGGAEKHMQVMTAWAPVAAIIGQHFIGIAPGLPWQQGQLAGIAPIGLGADAICAVLAALTCVCTAARERQNSLEALSTTRLQRSPQTRQSRRCARKKDMSIACILPWFCEVLKHPHPLNQGNRIYICQPRLSEFSACRFREKRFVSFLSCEESFEAFVSNLWVWMLNPYPSWKSSRRSPTLD